MADTEEEEVKILTRLPAGLRGAFKDACTANGVSMNTAVRRFIEDYVSPSANCCKPPAATEPGTGALCVACGIGFILPSGKCDHCGTPVDRYRPV